MKVMSFNVLEGGGPPERFTRILDLIRRERPDLLALQECLGWEDGVRMHEIAAALGIPPDDRHCALGHARPRGSGRRFHVALLSRPGLTDVQVHNPPHYVGHALLVATVPAGGAPLRVFATHLDSHNETLRFVESRHLRSVLDRDTFDRAHHLLLGDLNALSPRDPYPDDLADRVKAAGVDKYGHPPRFEVIPDLEDFGWIDSLRATDAPPAEWITAERDRGGVHIDYRTDYIFLSPSMKPLLEECAVVPAEGASDHHAVTARFRLA